MLDLAAVSSLRAVAATGSVVAAAEALGYTPSAVSQQVKRLERQAGVALLERLGRGVILTQHGRYLVESGSVLLDDLERLESDLHARAGAVAGSLRVAAFSTATRGLIGPVVGRLQREHPGLRISLRDREPWDTVDLVAAGQCDLGIVHRWGDVPLDVPDHLVQRRICLDLADVVVPRGHHLADAGVLRVADLVDEGWIATPADSICRQWLRRMFDGTGRLPRIAHESMEFDSHLALVRAGLGIALVPRLGRADLGDDLVAVRLTDPEPTREVIAVHRAGLTDSPGLTALLEALLVS
ncbi:LysR family transcriptional regulator [Nocardioides acrostichi]|uniref:LysR family transcriptional regulator n=1 Tax=Nocardioides acrostichi TaxID=2784339 RepID=A0A930Y7E4_9ACTN|nr:LysR family transcriptional regulator [Nocardioides acrostichi]MBF4161947.1 LysR family transcriptional regulator [Nocardioides acrostichi]